MGTRVTEVTCLGCNGTGRAQNWGYCLYCDGTGIRTLIVKTDTVSLEPVRRVEVPHRTEKELRAELLDQTPRGLRNAVRVWAWLHRVTGR